MTTTSMIRYRAGYRYQLAEAYGCIVAIHPAQRIDAPFITLTPAGGLTIDAGYAWDGPSGPAISTRTFMRSSLIHDVLCQLVRTGHLGREWIPAVHDEVQRICLEDGMCRARASWVRWAMRFADPATRPSGERPVLSAP